MADQDHYAILCVSKTATPAEIKAAYNSLVLVHHPDKGGDQETFVKVQKAWEILRDSESRAEFDKEQLKAETRKAQEEAETRKWQQAEQSRKPRKEAFTERTPWDDRETPRQPEPKERRKRDEGRKQPAEDTNKPEQWRRDAAAKGFTYMDKDGEFIFEGVFKGHTKVEYTSYRPHADKNRNATQAGARPRDQTAPKQTDQSPPRDRNQASPRRREQAPHKNRDQAPPKHREHLSPQDRDNQPPKHRDHETPTFEQLKRTATHHLDQFDGACYKLQSASKDDISKADEIWCHLGHVKDLLSKRILTISLAEQEYIVQEFRQGPKEGPLKPTKETINKLASQVDEDHESLKVAADLMVMVYDAVKELHGATQKRQALVEADRTQGRDKLDAAIRVLHKFLVRSLRKN